MDNKPYSPLSSGSKPVYTSAPVDPDRISPWERLRSWNGPHLDLSVKTGFKMRLYTNRLLCQKHQRRKRNQHFKNSWSCEYWACPQSKEVLSADKPCRVRFPTKAVKNHELFKASKSESDS